MAAFVDSNVLIDVLGRDTPWRAWSTDRLVEWAARGPLLINDIVYAEVSVSFQHQRDLDRSVRELDLHRAPLDDASLFAAGKAFLAYRKSKGERHSILPDFIIGAHASTLGMALITRDTRRFPTYFPGITLVTP